MMYNLWINGEKYKIALVKLESLESWKLIPTGKFKTEFDLGNCIHKAEMFTIKMTRELRGREFRRKSIDWTLGVNQLIGRDAFDNYYLIRVEE